MIAICVSRTIINRLPMDGRKWMQLCAAISVAVILAGCGSTKKTVSWQAAATQSHPWGYYTGVPVTQWNSDGRSMTLLQELRYTDPQGTVWVAPAGAVVDGASIPRSLWSFMGGPFEGKYRNASVLHDCSYDRRGRPPAECDRMFYNAMRCSGVSAVEAKTMYYSLLRFGDHWRFPIKRAKPFKIGRKMVARAEESEAATTTTVAAQQQILGMRDWIRNTSPSIEQIEQRANEESH
jgi:hypothetical protein